MSVADIRELAELSVKTQAEAVDLIRSRIRQGVAAVNALLEDWACERHNHPPRRVCLAGPIGDRQ